jgi:hypothetical protein
MEKKTSRFPIIFALQWCTWLIFRLRGTTSTAMTFSGLERLGIGKLSSVEDHPENVIGKKSNWPSLSPAWPLVQRGL